MPSAKLRFRKMECESDRPEVTLVKRGKVNFVGRSKGLKSLTRKMQYVPLIFQDTLKFSSSSSGAKVGSYMHR